MSTYATSDAVPGDGGELRSDRTANVSSLAFAYITVTGGGTGTVSGSGPGDPAPPAAVAYLWPRGDGTPAGT